MTKAELRKEIKQRMENNKGHFSEWSKALCKNIIQSKAFAECQIVLGYMALPDEADILQVMEEALVMNKKVYIPRIIPDTNEMEFYSYSKKLMEGSFGILEPDTSSVKFENKAYSEKILVLVPGRAFSKSGQRLGRGKGFYDKFLAELKGLNKENATLGGVGFVIQMEEKIKTESHDLSMDSVFTETDSIIQCLQ